MVGWLKLFLGCSVPILVLLADRGGDKRHRQALAARLAAADTGSAPWYDRDPVLTAMRANRLGFAVWMLPVWALLAIAGLLVFRGSGPGCCADLASWLVFPAHDFPAGPLPWLAFIGYLTGVSGVVLCSLFIAGRVWERRVARRLRSLAATAATATPMWLTLFRKAEQMYVEGSGLHTVISGWAVLWPTRPTLDIATPPSDPLHRQAVTVRLVNRHELPGPDNRWSAPEQVTVLGKPVPGEWVVIRAAGRAFWPARRVRSSATWRRAYSRVYHENRRRTRARSKHLRRH